MYINQCWIPDPVPDPDFFPSHIPYPYCQILDPTSKKEEEKLVVLPFCSHKYHKIENYFIFEQVQKIIFEPIDLSIFKYF